MTDLLEFLKDLPSLVASAGYVALALIVFAESGVMLGFFLPGDSLLFTAGIFAARGDLNLAILLPSLFLAAVAGDSFGYAFGRKAGSRLFARPNARFFKQSYVDRTRSFYDRHGSKTIVLARFVPIVRTFAPILAGVAGMPYRKFAGFNLAGGFLWVVGVTLAGFWLGSAVGDIDRYLLPIIVAIVFLSLLPPALEVLKTRRAKA